MVRMVDGSMGFLSSNLIKINNFLGIKTFQYWIIKFDFFFLSSIDIILISVGQRPFFFVKKPIDSICRNTCATVQSFFLYSAFYCSPFRGFSGCESFYERNMKRNEKKNCRSNAHYIDLCILELKWKLKSNFRNSIECCCCPFEDREKKVFFFSHSREYFFYSSVAWAADIAHAKRKPYENVYISMNVNWVCQLVKITFNFLTSKWNFKRKAMWLFFFSLVSFVGRSFCFVIHWTYAYYETIFLTFWTQFKCKH